MALLNWPWWYPPICAPAELVMTEPPIYGLAELAMVVPPICAPAEPVMVAPYICGLPKLAMVTGVTLWL